MTTNNVQMPWWALDQFAGRNDPAFELELLARLNEGSPDAEEIDSNSRLAVAA